MDNCFLFYFFPPYYTACGILIPQPRIEPAPPALEAQSFNQWTSREVLTTGFSQKNKSNSVLNLFNKWCWETNIHHAKGFIWTFSSKWIRDLNIVWELKLCNSHALWVTDWQFCLHTGHTYTHHNSSGIKNKNRAQNIRQEVRPFHSGGTRNENTLKRTYDLYLLKTVSMHPTWAGDLFHPR